MLKEYIDNYKPRLVDWILNGKTDIAKTPLELLDGHRFTALCEQMPTGIPVSALVQLLLDMHLHVDEIVEGFRYIPAAFARDLDIEFINIPEVSAVYDESFKNCKYLKRVRIEDNCKYIYDRAFAGCESLEEINLPSSLKFICEQAFEGCKSLKKVELPLSLDYIGKGSFALCDDLSITYKGIVKQFLAIDGVSESNWYNGTYVRISCKDGDLEYDGNF